MHFGNWLGFSTFFHPSPIPCRQWKEARGHHLESLGKLPFLWSVLLTLSRSHFLSTEAALVLTSSLRKKKKTKQTNLTNQTINPRVKFMHLKPRKNLILGQEREEPFSRSHKLSRWEGSSLCSLHGSDWLHLDICLFKLLLHREKQILLGSCIRRTVCGLVLVICMVLLLLIPL